AGALDTRMMSADSARSNPPPTARPPTAVRIGLFKSRKLPDAMEAADAVVVAHPGSGRGRLQTPAGGEELANASGDDGDPQVGIVTKPLKIAPIRPADLFCTDPSSASWRRANLLCRRSGRVR